MSATPSQIAAAAAYIQANGVQNVSAPRLAASASELGKSFKDTLEYLARLLSGGQGQGPAPSVTKKVPRLDPKNAIGGEDPDYVGGAS